MSGDFRPEQNTRILATDDPALAKQHGLTEWDEVRGQYVAPREDDVEVHDLGVGRVVLRQRPANPEVVSDPVVVSESGPEIEAPQGDHVEPTSRKRSE